MEAFYTEIYINTSSEKVWKAFVEPNQFFKEFYNADIRSSFIVGERIEYSGIYKGKKTIHIYGKILEYKKGETIAYTDHPGPMYMSNHAELKSRVKATFEELGQLTRLTITNDQFSPGNPMQNEAKQWYLILSNLKTWIETGYLMTLPKQ